jgi:hypothetical protein
MASRMVCNVPLAHVSFFILEAQAACPASYQVKCLIQVWRGVPQPPPYHCVTPAVQLKTLRKSLGLGRIRRSTGHDRPTSYLRMNAVSQVVVDMPIDRGALARPDAR